uniref:Probable tRNA sulfurtransferase n=1 Tax=uncultured bacterium contig00077 TaxID=1181555 RepID=A0A806KP15_9BACT|nr:thiamine biosynthesis protein thiI [uncultured bacterium contig00077]
MLSGASGAKLKTTKGRFFVECPSEQSQIVENALSRLIGISGWAKTATCQKTTEEVLALCVEEAKKIKESGGQTFKIDSRRTDKSFPLSSYDLCCRAGEAILKEIDGLKVDIHKPDDVIHVEIREKAYIYSGGKKGLGGLPVGSAGRGLLLLSGGIDSPVAGFLMAARGMKTEAIHFHAYPYTALEAKEKVIRLARITGAYCMGIHLYILCFTPVQTRIKEKAPPEWSTVLLRMAMMEAAEKAAVKIKAKCLITGESLSQVASQTIENLNCTGSRLKLPVLRPLIGMDKEGIIKISEKIGAFETSIEPHTDCCTLFTPKHPILRGDVEEANALYESLELQALIDEALAGYELVKC